MTSLFNNIYNYLHKSLGKIDKVNGNVSALRFLPTVTIHWMAIVLFGIVLSVLFSVIALRVSNEGLSIDQK